MEYPLNIAFHHVPRSPQTVTFVNKKANKLNCFADRITNCRVVIDTPGVPGKNGNLFRVRIIISLPDYKIIIGNNPAERHLYKSLSYAIIDTFDTAYNLVWNYFHNP